jgi:hypothetical protein
LAQRRVDSGGGSRGGSGGGSGGSAATTEAAAAVAAAAAGSMGMGSGALMTGMNGNAQSTINIPPRVCSVAEQKWGKKNVLDGRRQHQTEPVDLLPTEGDGKGSGGGRASSVILVAGWRLHFCGRDVSMKLWLFFSTCKGCVPKPSGDFRGSILVVVVACKQALKRLTTNGAYASAFLTSFVIA